MRTRMTRDLSVEVGRKVVATERLKTAPTGRNGRTNLDRFGNLTYSERSSLYGRTVAFGREFEDSYEELRFRDPVKDRRTPKRIDHKKVEALRAAKVEKAIAHIQKLPVTLIQSYLSSLPADLRSEVLKAA